MIKRIFHLPHFLPLSILCILSFFIYSNTLTFGYNGDDDVFIGENAITRAGLERVKEIFTDDGVLNGWFDKDSIKAENQGFRKRYRPVSQFSFALEIAAWGMWPQLSHLINVILYSISVLLLYLLLIKLPFKPSQWFVSIAFWACVLFSLHPVHTEVVANIKSRDEILALLFFLLAMSISLKRGNFFRQILIFILFLVSLCSKENAIVFVAIVPLFYFMISSRKFNFKESFQVVLPYLLAALTYLVLLAVCLKDNDVRWSKDIFTDYFYQLLPSEKYGTIMLSLAKNLQLLLFPLRLICDYSPYQIPIISLFNPIAIFIALLHIALLIFAIKKIKDLNILAFSILFYFTSMSLYSNLLFSTGNAVAERFLYIPSIAICITVAYFLLDKINSVKKMPAKTGVVLLVLLSGYFAVKTYSRNFDWKEPKSLFTADVKKKNNCARLNYGYAEFYFSGKKEEAQNKDSLRVAINYYLKAVSIYPNYVEALNQLGTAYYYHSKFDSASYYFLKSLETNPEQLQIIKNISLSIDSIQIGKSRIGFRKRLIEINPRLAPLYYFLGKDYELLANKDSAVLFYQKSLQLNPGYKKASEQLEKLTH